MIKVYHKEMSGNLDTSKEIEIEQAIVGSIGDSVDYYSRGSQAVAEKTNKQSELIGKIIQILVEKNLISPDELDSMLGFRYGSSE